MSDEAHLTTASALSTNEQCELTDLRANLAAGTCCGRKASRQQQNVRRRRIAVLEAN